jgi:hypothetical protein
MFGVSHVRFFKKAVAKRTLRFADRKLFSSVPNDPKGKFLAQLCSFLDRHCSHIRRRIRIYRDGRECEPDQGNYREAP